MDCCSRLLARSDAFHNVRVDVYNLIHLLHYLYLLTQILGEEIHNPLDRFFISCNSLFTDPDFGGRNSQPSRPIFHLLHYLYLLTQILGEEIHNPLDRFLSERAKRARTLISGKFFGVVTS